MTNWKNRLCLKCLSSLNKESESESDTDKSRTKYECAPTRAQKLLCMKTSVTKVTSTEFLRIKELCLRQVSIRSVCLEKRLTLS